MAQLPFGSRGHAPAVSRVALQALLLAGALVLVACSNGGDGLSRAEVEEVVRAEGAGSEPGLTLTDVEEAVQAALEAAPEPEPELTLTDVEEAVQAALDAAPEPEPELTLTDVEEAVQAALDAAPEPEPGLTLTDVEEAISGGVAEMLADVLPPGSVFSSEEIRRIARNEVATIPPKSAPADYTKFFVDNAISRYEADGLDATVAHYSRSDSVDGQWYVFIVDAGGELVAHPRDGIIGENLNDALGTDINGYEFGTQMLAATEAGLWVPYVYANPATGTLGNDAEFELKMAWVVRHEGLIFGSGWYVDAEEFLPELIAESAKHFRRGGLPAILEFYNSPDGISVGLIPTAEYYNATNILDGYFSGFIADPDGTLRAHIDPMLIGTDVEDLLGPAVRNATADGTWISADDNPPGAGPETMRIWMMDVNGSLIGGGWYSIQPN